MMELQDLKVSLDATEQRWGLLSLIVDSMWIILDLKVWKAIKWLCV